MPKDGAEWLSIYFALRYLDFPQIKGNLRTDKNY